VQTPCSFFKWIFVPVDWCDTPQSTAHYMLAHERAHAKGWHSLDVVLMECLCAVFWFHPMVYWYRRSLRVVHEYLADAEASCLTDKKQYGLLLIRQSQSGMPVAFANHFFQSPLKQRLIMLMKKHSAPVRALRYGLVLPLAALFILLFQQAPVIAQEVNSKGDTNGQLQQAGNSTFEGQPAEGNLNPCEQEPAFPGGMEALMDFLTKNIQYPKNAEGALQEGMVVTSFTVNEVGGIQNVYIKNPTEMPAAYNAEALRVVSMLPKWTPGKKNCKAGLFELCIPIKFKADGQPVSKAQQPVSDVSDLQTPPRFTGGQEALFKFLVENIKYPEAAKQAKAEGIVVVKFIVEKDGSISQVEAHNSNGIHADLVSEAIRVAQSMPKWVPGVLKGEIVRVQFALPIRFKLD
jgi:TonB family protein